ncbi:MAG: redoxin domain-containing protein [Pseudomonadota bacterium]
MTQLVQLQSALPTLHGAGYEVYAISNDTVERLAEFAERHSISFDLLADEDSGVIRAFGIMNTLVEPGEGKHMRWYGIPYPGTFITDANGTIVDKDFHQHHARRLSGPALAHRVLGTDPEPHRDAPMATTADAELSVAASLTDPTLRLEVISMMTVEIDIAHGRHIYAAGAPQAFTPVGLRVEGTGVRADAPIWPVPTALSMAELGMEVPVYTGKVRVSVPVTATSEIIRLGHGLDYDRAEVTITCSYQSCDEYACALPTTVQTTLCVPLETLVEPPGIQSYADRVTRERTKALHQGSSRGTHDPHD